MATVVSCVALLFLWCCSLVGSTVFTDGKWVVEWRQDASAGPRLGGLSCFLYDIRNGTSPGPQFRARPPQLHTTNSSSLSVLVDRCIRKQSFDLLRPQKTRGKRSPGKSFLAMYPGTKWCGPGNVASGPDDLGPARKTDACCRDHDTKCDIYILSKETKYGVTNNEFYTVNDCSCDNKFKDCLQRANTVISHTVGELFFNFVRVKCLRVTSAVNASVTGRIQQAQLYRGGAVGKLLSGLGF